MPELEKMINRQRILAAFGEFAIRSESLDDILTEACRLVGEAAGTGRAKVLEIQESRQELLVRAGVGWAPDVVGVVRLPMSEHSSETYAINVAKPVVSQDIATESRFEVPDFMQQAGVVALVNVPIFVPGQRPYGVLQIDDTRPRAFGDDEVEFLRTYAVILGPVIDRLQLVEKRAKDQEKFRTTEARHSFLIGSWAQAEWEADVNGVVVADSPSWRAYTGQTLEEWLGYGWLDAVHPDDRAYAENQWRETILARGLLDAEFRLRAPDGGWRWTNVRAAPVVDVGGDIEKWAGMNINIDARKRAEEALLSSEGRLRVLMEGVPQLIWRSRDDGLWTWASPQWLDYTGQTQEESHGLKWLEAVHPDDHFAAEQAWHEARLHGRLDVEFRIRRVMDGAWRWHQTRSMPVRAAPGTNGSEGPILEWLGTTTDIEDLKRLQGQQQVMVAELQHRTRNLLGIVRNVARRSIGPSAGRDEYESRLSALGRVQGFLSRSAFYAVPLAELVTAELDAVGSGSSSKVVVAGPPVTLPGEGVQTIALALHELATNAAKYGAIAQASGQLSVTWDVQANDTSSGERLVIEWRESGVSMPPGPPSRHGYGSELITRALPYQLSAETLLEFSDDGVHCRIALPGSAFSVASAE